MKRGWIAWLAVLVPTWIVLVLCAHWEPVLRDGWGHVQWHKSFATTPGNVWMFAHDSYVHNNPRFGQVLTLLVYTPGPWHAIFTPIVELLLFYLLALHALGRRPSFARSSDALMFATILGMVALTAPLVVDRDHARRWRDRRDVQRAHGSGDGRVRGVRDPRVLEARPAACGMDDCGFCWFFCWWFCSLLRARFGFLF